VGATWGRAQLETAPSILWQSEWKGFSPPWGFRIPQYLLPPQACLLVFSLSPFFFFFFFSKSRIRQKNLSAPPFFYQEKTRFGPPPWGRPEGLFVFFPFNPNIAEAGPPCSPAPPPPPPGGVHPFPMPAPRARNAPPCSQNPPFVFFGNFAIAFFFFLGPKKGRGPRRRETSQRAFSPSSPPPFFSNPKNLPRPF